MSGFNFMIMYLLTKIAKAFPIMHPQGNGMSNLGKELNWKLRVSFKMSAQKPD